MIEMTHSKEVAKHIYKAISSKSVMDIKVLEVASLTTLADIFIIAIVSNTRLVAALSDEIEEQLKLKGYHLAGKEGYNTAKWILLDYEGVIVHIFYKEEAEFYKLDRLWNDAKVLQMK